MPVLFHCTDAKNLFITDHKSRSVLGSCKFSKSVQTAKVIYNVNHETKEKSVVLKFEELYVTFNIFHNLAYLIPGLIN